MKKVRIDMKNVDPKYKHLVKPEMTREELAVFGTTIMKLKIESFKNRVKGWFKNE